MSSKTAPVGRVTLVFTDIQGSTRVWEAEQDVARHSLRAHDAVMRASLHRHGGYEVKTEGDSFMVAFTHPVRALQFCLEVQRELQGHPWSPDLLALPEAAEAPGFRGLRVRMGVHIGEPEARARGNRVDYFGPMVNRAARIANAGHGGQILASKGAWNLARTKFRDAAAAMSLGKFRLRGLAGTQEIVQVLPTELAERTFPPIRADAADN
jgi:class 3 adenylate cyclase